MKKLFYFCLFLFFSDTLYAKGSVTIKNYGSNRQQNYGDSASSDQRSFLVTSFGKRGNITPFKFGVGINTQTFNPTTFADVTDIQISPEDYDDYDQSDQDPNVIIENDYPYDDEY